MTRPEFAQIALLLVNGWKGDVDEGQIAAYGEFLLPYEYDVVRTALHRLMAKGVPFTPAVSEIIAAIHEDAGRPTWEEAYRLIFGSRGVLDVGPPPGPYTSERERTAAQDEVALVRAETMHPLIAAFVRVQGLDHLRRLPVGVQGGADRDYGLLERRRLGEAWERFVERVEEREATALAVGPTAAAEELRRLDPLAALGRADRPQLDAG